MACPLLHFPGVTAVEWSSLKAAAVVKAGIEVTSDRGTYEGHGFRATWDYSGTVLVIQVLETPALVSCGFVNSQIEHAVKENL